MNTSCQELLFLLNDYFYKNIIFLNYLSHYYQNDQFNKKLNNNQLVSVNAYFEPIAKAFIKAVNDYKLIRISVFIEKFLLF